MTTTPWIVCKGEQLFERIGKCGSCEGSGRYAHPGAPMSSGVCYRCKGRGRILKQISLRTARKRLEV